MIMHKSHIQTEVQYGVALGEIQYERKTVTPMEKKPKSSYAQNSYDMVGDYYNAVSIHEMKISLAGVNIDVWV